MHSNSRLWLLWHSLVMAAAFACSPQDDGVGSSLVNDPSNAEGDQEPGDGEEPTGPEAPPMDGGAPVERDAEIIIVAPPDATCAATAQVAEKVVVEKQVTVEVPKEVIKPVALYLMLDRSSSMVGACRAPQPPCNAQSWSQATQAITAFVNDPASANIDVALGYFPPIVPASDISPAGPLCSGVSCGTPTVSMRKAGANAASITDSLNASVPPATGRLLTTPTECGIRGLSDFCKAHRQSTGEKCVAVLITDGAPSECNQDTAALRQFAASAAAEGTPMFTLGMTGANFAFLNEIALGGGTDCTPNAEGNACDVSAGKEAFLAALNAIRDKEIIKETHTETHTETHEVPIDCEWNVPPPPDGMKFDKEKVNVSFSATGAPARTLGRVDALADCEKFPEAWHYDDLDAPKKILACAKSCEQIKVSAGARISIEFGCQGVALE